MNRFTDLNSSAVSSFRKKNPTFDILLSGLHDMQLVARLDWTGLEAEKDAILSGLGQVQRIMRTGTDADLAKQLIARGYFSAHHIACFAEHQFVRDNLDLFEGNRERAEQLYRRATHIKESIKQVYAWTKSTIASPFYRAIRSSYLDAKLTSTLSDIPSYQDLFGNLDYLDCEHCESIFGPAAYFADLMRLTDQGLTDPNKNTIPSLYKLEERRPDLFDLELSCANILTIMPYLDIVNRILEKQIETITGAASAYKVLATSSYPINLPFNQPLARIRTSLQKLNSSLFAVYRSLQNTSQDQGVARIDIACEHLGLSVEDLKILTTPDSSPASVTSRFGYATGSRLLEFAGDGVVDVVKGSCECTGANTRFTLQVRVGDQLRVGSQTRTVTEILSDTALNTGFPWQESVASQSYNVLPKDGVFRVAEFLARTGLTHQGLQDLITEQLDSEELATGIAAELYINNTGEGLPRLELIFDQSDPDQPMDRIENLSWSRLDRVNRFLRLRLALDWAYADVDWVIRRAGENPGAEISEGLIINISTILSLLEKTETPFDQLAGLWSDLKTIGRVNKDAPRDAFDHTFNNPALLEGRDPYDVGSSVPFNPSRNPVQQWTIAGKSAEDQVIRSRLAAALSLTDSDLVVMAGFVLHLNGDASGLFNLDLPNLSALYRFGILANLSSLTMQQLLTLLCLMYYPDSPYLEPPTHAVPATIGATAEIMDAAAWLVRASIDVFQLKYSLTEEGSAYFDRSYNHQDIPGFLGSLAALGLSAHLTPRAFIFEDLTSKEADDLFATLVEEHVLTPLGLLLARAESFDPAALFLLHNTAFVGPEITEQQSNAVFQALLQHGLLLPTPAGESAVLSSKFTAKTQLNFLEQIFTGLDAPAQISSVRSMLLKTRGFTEHTADVLAKAGVNQNDVLAEGLSSFTGTSKKLVASFFPLAAVESSLTDYLAAFLTPLTEDKEPSEAVIKFIAVNTRFSSLAGAIGLAPGDVAALLSDPHHFNIERVAGLTIQGVRTLSDFKDVERELNIRGAGLLEYFALPKDANCPGSKIKRLAKITGWNATQICELIEVFWPKDHPGVKTADYDTVAGLGKLKRCFDQARSLGLDVEGLLGLTAISHLPVENSDRSINDQNWEVFSRLAGKSLDMVSARFGVVEFNKINNEITGEINSISRDHLLGHALWLISQRLPEIAGSSDLYQYLLIDVDMGRCMDTSLIEQGIASVQLYMQRCRMMQESGVEVIRIKKVWWTWISNYRVWEVNRKIYLYPENYLDPTLRSTATPLFKKLSEDLTQTPISKSTVAAPFEGYLRELDVLAGLQHCAAYCAAIRDPDIDETTDRLYLFAKTLTEPTTYYYRVLDEIRGWGPFQKIDLSIATSNVAPVYAYGRLFLFWLEADMGQSSSIQAQKSETETLSKSTLKFSFVSSGGRWVQPQVVRQNVIAKAYPNNYPSLDNSAIQLLLDPADFAWQVPYGLSLDAGFVGAGRVSVVRGLKRVVGTLTSFDREVTAGDRIWCNGEARTVEVVASSNDLGVDRSWSVDASSAMYHVIPRKRNARLEPFVGPGTVSTTTVTSSVIGKDTAFLSTFHPGDKMVVGDETRIVAIVPADTQLVVDRAWAQATQNGSYTVIPNRNPNERLVLLLGSALPVSYDGNFSKPPVDANPGMNLFLEHRNFFNDSMFATMSTASLARTENIDGVVTMGPVFVFDRNLQLERTRITIADYKFSSPRTPQPYAAILDRNQELLTVVRSRNALSDSYWGGNVAGPVHNVFAGLPAPGLNILYYVSEARASLVNVGNQPGWYLFNNSDEAFLVQSQEQDLNKLSEMVFLEAKPAPELPNNLIASAGAHTSTPEAFEKLKFQFARITTATVSTLMQRLFAGGIDNLLTVDSQELPELPFSRFYPAPGKAPPPATIPPPTDKLDFYGAFGLYFYELFFHAPLLISWLLSANKRFEEAKSWLEYIFNPMQEPDPEHLQDSRRFWRFLPFRTLDQESLIKTLTDKRQIARYNNDPFNPDVIADIRPVAYAKEVVMRYVDNLLEWGDLLFAQDTRETITQATNLYILASDLLGPRPRALGKKPSPKPITFRQIRAHYPAGIPQFVIDLENTPFSNWNVQGPEMDRVPINDIASYFCVPENSDLMKYWDRVEDRIFKIRHCMNISGVVRSLALFEAPIDARQLSRALASGSGLPSLAGQLKPAIPYYRFDYLIDKAKEFVNSVQVLGGQLQSAYDVKSSAELELLQVRQEKRILELTTTTLENDIQEAIKAESSLQSSLGSAQYRKAHNQKLLDDDISPSERTNLDSMLTSLIFQTVAGVTETAAAINYTLPDVGSPFAMKYGGTQLGNTLTAVSGALQFAANVANAVADRSGTMASYERRRQDWQLEIDLAGYDETQITAELAATTIRRETAEVQLTIHKETIRQNQETEQFLRGRFSNSDLQQWMINRISTLYFQAYAMAYEMAVAAQQAFQYEYNTTQTFLEFGYWDDRTAGLLAGEGLQLSLQQMDKARLNHPARTLEIQKRFSLAEVDPLELLRLKSEGECVIRLTEKLFDYDFPGHFLRKVKAVSVTIDAEEGTFTGISGTLTQLSNYIVMKNEAEGVNAVNFLLGGKSARTPGTGAIRSNWWSNQEIALSTGIDDTGLFELYLTGNISYLPFEGTGAVSTWRLTLPLMTNRFDFDAINDVTLRLQYTAVNGGAKFRDEILKLPALKPFAGVMLLDMRTLYKDEWIKFITDHSSSDRQILDFEIDEFVPAHIQKARVTKVSLALTAAVSAPGSYIQFTVNDNITLQVELSPANLWSYGFKDHAEQDPTTASVVDAKHKIIFDLAKTPDDLKDSEGQYLDPEKLSDVQIVLFYEGDPKP